MPGRELSNRNIELILEGVRITGFAAVDRPVEHSSEPLITKKVGADGTHYNTDTGDLGGMVTIRLAPNSPSVPFFLKKRAIRRARGFIPSSNGSYSSFEEGKQLEYIGISYEQIPPTYEPGADYEVMLDVEDLDEAADSIALGTSPVNV